MFYLNLSFYRELTLFWSKLQRRIDPSLDTFLERCRQFGVIAKTQQHLFCLIRVIQTEVSNFSFYDDCPRTEEMSGEITSQTTPFRRGKIMELDVPRCFCRLTF